MIREFWSQRRLTAPLTERRTLEPICGQSSTAGDSSHAMYPRVDLSEETLTLCSQYVCSGHASAAVLLAMSCRTGPRLFLDRPYLDEILQLLWSPTPSS